MRPELDRDGPAAPPRANGELSFDQPWQGRLFATTMAACDAGVIDYERFREHLIAQIARRDLREVPVDEYWSAWQDGLEDLAEEDGLLTGDEVARRATDLTRH